MRLLLDTNVLLWSVRSPQRLGPETIRMVRDLERDVAFSAASIWEVAIKSALRRPDFDVSPERLLSAARLDFREVAVSSAAAVRVASLPPHHRDPFDRLLIAQALEENAVLLTADRALLAYGPAVRLAS